jgi:L,D-transpeptidase catalytic domain
MILRSRVRVSSFCVAVGLGTLAVLVSPVASARAESAPTGAESTPTGVDAKVFDLAVAAASCAVRAGLADAPRTLTIIDYSKPSTSERLWVLDYSTRQVLYRELVAHGQGSGANFATSFSNQPETHQSSLGLFLTTDTYTGKNGYSLRLDGLEPGFNDRARERAIVMHGAPYVDTELAKAQGRLGRSWGCPALREAVARQIIDRVKGGGLLFVYYPDMDWLTRSRLLGQCAAAAFS